MRILLRVLPTIAALAGIVALFRQFPDGLVWAIIPCTLVILLACVIRTNQIVPALFVASTTLCGLLLAAVLPFNTITHFGDPSGRIVCDIVGSAIGGLLGMAYFELRR